MSQIQSRAHATWHIDTFITAMNAHIQQVRNVRQGGIQVGSTHNVWVRHRPFTLKLILRQSSLLTNIVLFVIHFVY